MNTYIEQIPAGKKKFADIRIPGADILLPATIIHGSCPGRNILITAGMHSGEYPGIPASMEAAEQIDPNEVRGNIFIIHCLNPSGFRQRTDNYVPEDGKNLNRIFPGSQSGTTADRIAAFICDALLPGTDFIIDLHSGGSSEILTDHLYFPAAEPARGESLRVASYLGYPYLTASFSCGGEIGYAGNKKGIPGLLLERGHSGYCLPEWISRMKEDIFTALQVLQVLPGMPEMAQKQTIFEKAFYPEADTEGLWFPFVSADEKIRRGQTLGEIRNFKNEILRTVSAEADGIVLYFTPGLSVLPGWPLVAYGVSEEFA